MEYIIICSPTDDAKKKDVCLVFAQQKRKKKKEATKVKGLLKGLQKKKKGDSL